MPTLLRERHRPFFMSLTEDQVALVFDRVTKTWPADFRTYPMDHPPRAPVELFETCQRAGLDHARVVMAMATVSSDTGRSAIETLIGKPIEPWCPPDPAPMAAPVASHRPAAAPTGDNRVVLEIKATNPHREGSTAWKEFNMWRVGATVGELLQKGLSRRGMRRGFRNGWIVVTGGATAEEMGGDDA